MFVNFFHTEDDARNFPIVDLIRCRGDRLYTMAEHRRPLYGVLIGLMLCVSLWQISLQEAQFVPEYPLSNDLNTAPNSLSIAKPSENNHNNHYVTDNAITYSAAISLDQLPAEDAHQLIDLHNFKYLIKQPPCSPTDHPNRTLTSLPTPHTLILIHSAPLNWNKRNVIRETWGREDPRARLYFLLGAVKTRHLQHKLEKENYLFGDIIQGNFMDAYRNMTYKHVMGLKWLSYNCPETKYLLKTDDDVFVNAPNMYEFLQDPTTLRSELLFCDLSLNVRVSRSYRSKWRVSPSEYKGKTYPAYCPGYSIVYSADTAFALYREAQRTPYFWIDDIHVTGTLAAAANITITPLGASYLSAAELDDLLDGGLQPSYEYFLFTRPNLTEEKIRAIWRQVSNARSRMNATSFLSSSSASNPGALSASPVLENR